MASPHPQLTAGIAAFQAEDYTAAIPHLQAACAETEGDGRLQAQGWLVRAYVKTQQVDAARQLCGELTQCDRPKIRTWAAQTLAQLTASAGQSVPSQSAPVGSTVPTDVIASNPAPMEATPTEAADDPVDEQGLIAHLAPGEPLAPEAAEALLEKGIKTLRKDRFDEAIPALEDFVRGTDESYRNYRWGLTSLVKAYSGHDQNKQAIALCQSLLHHPQESLQDWARDYLKKLAPEQIGPTSPAEPHQQESVPPHPEPLPQPPAETSPPSSFPTTYGKPPQRSTRRASSPTRSGSQDLTPQILSAVAHGSISLLGSLLIFVLFPESFFANTLGTLRFLVPVLILFTTQHPLAKANAREATNYVLTCLILIVALGLVGWILALGLIAMVFAFPPLAILIALPLIAYSTALSIWPVIAVVLVIRGQDEAFRYPNWLVIHFL
jgi:uncharacterized Tic20 family protein